MSIFIKTKDLKMEEKRKEIIEEVMDEVNSALEDPRGINKHQRRIAFSLSLGTVTLIESYLEKLNVLKPGGKINHLWLKKKKENVKELVSNQIVAPIEKIKNIDKFLEIAYSIEKERNQLAYGKTVSENYLKNKINLFLKLNEEIENV